MPLRCAFGVQRDVWRIDASGVPAPSQGTHKGMPLRFAFGEPRDVRRAIAVGVIRIGRENGVANCRILA